MTASSKPLSSLGLTARSGGDPAVTGVTLDSRAVTPGSLFAALPGSRVHGAAFVPMALERGAAAILTDAAGAEMAGPAIRAAGAALIVAVDPRAALSAAAALWFGAQPGVMVAVTNAQRLKQRMSTDGTSTYNTSSFAFAKPTPVRAGNMAWNGTGASSTARTGRPAMR